MYLEGIYERMRDSHLCESAYEFSTVYLGKAESYYSVLKARNMEPSIDALVTLELSLINKASYYNDTATPFIVNTRNKLLRLSEEVSNYRTERTQDKLKNSPRARYRKPIESVI